jgi:endoglucanase
MDIDLYLWKPDGASGEKAVSTVQPHSGSGSLAIANSDDWAMVSRHGNLFTPKPDHSYSVVLWMRGEGVSGPEACRLHPFENRLQCPRALVFLEQWTGGYAIDRNKDSLAAEIDAALSWGEDNDVPVFLGEFGVIHHCYEHGRGGLRWVDDTLDILMARNVHFTFHAYHEQNFAVYRGNPNTRLPLDSQVNQPLIDLFEAKLSAP